MSVAQRVSKHYGFGRVRETVLAAVADAGLDPEALRPEDLAPVDEFHTRGREATDDLIRALQLEPEMHVLDLGSGVGGPARHVASVVGCRVTGVDLVDEYVEFARDLGARCGLDARLAFRQGDATRLPFEDASFDAVMTQHACMNIVDKAAVYREAVRLLPPGGRFGLYDLMQGPGGAPFYPVPWARDRSTSFLATLRETRELLNAAGFEIVSISDRTDDCIDWLEAMRRRAASEARPLGIHLLLGAGFPQIAANLLRNLGHRRVSAIQVICRRPA